MNSPDSAAPGNTFYLLDFDRTLADTNALDQLFNEIRQRHDGEPHHEITRRFVTEAKQRDLLMPHAKELMQLLDERGDPYGMLTYGEEAWQLAKIEATGLDHVPFLITQIEEKGLVLQGWQHVPGVFTLPAAFSPDIRPLITRSIVFVDDKVISFKDLPTGVRGIQVQPEKHEVLPFQKGELPGGVVRCVGLQEVIKELFY